MKTIGVAQWVAAGTSWVSILCVSKVKMCVSKGHIYALYIVLIITVHNKANNNKIAVTNTLHTNKDNLCKLIPLVLVFKTVTQNTKKESIYCIDKIYTV